MGPNDLAPNTVPPEFVDREQAILSERNWFYNSLPPQAKEVFLDTLSGARDRGLDNEAAWVEAVRAVESTYPPDVGQRTALDERLPPPGP